MDKHEDHLDLTYVNVYLLAREINDCPEVAPTGEVFVLPKEAAELRDDRNAMPEGAQHMVLSGGLYGVTELALCEINHLVLHPDQLYVFRRIPGCQACAEYDKQN